MLPKLDSKNAMERGEEVLLCSFIKKRFLTANVKRMTLNFRAKISPLLGSQVKVQGETKMNPDWQRIFCDGLSKVS